MKPRLHAVVASLVREDRLKVDRQDWPSQFYMLRFGGHWLPVSLRTVYNLAQSAIEHRGLHVPETDVITLIRALAAALPTLSYAEWKQPFDDAAMIAHPRWAERPDEREWRQRRHRHGRHAA